MLGIRTPRRSERGGRGAPKHLGVIFALLSLFHYVPALRWRECRLGQLRLQELPILRRLGTWRLTIWLVRLPVLFLLQRGMGVASKTGG